MICERTLKDLPQDLPQKTAGKWLHQILVAIALTMPVNTVLAQDDSCTHWSHFATLGYTDVNSQGMVTSSEFQLVGNLIYRPLLSTDEFYWLGFELYEAQSYMDGTESTELVYEVPFAVKIDRGHGGVLDYVYNANLKQADKSKLSGIYDALHIARPEKGDNPNNYAVEGYDDLGTYLTRYTVENDITTKSRELYTQVGISTMAANVAPIEDVFVNEDVTEYTQDECWITSAAGISDMDVLTKGDMLNIHVRQQIDVERNVEPLPLNARILNLPLDPADWEMIAEELVYPKPERVPEASGDLFLKRLAAMDFETMSSDQILQYLYDNEEYIPLLKTPLWAGAYEDAFERRLFLMIGKNDSANAHWLLTEIYVDETFENDARFRSLMALKYSEKPISIDLIENIFAYSHDLQGDNAQLGHSAMMVMGIIAKNQLDQDFGRYLSDRIALELRGNVDTQESAALLTALSNSGDVEQQDLVTSYLGNDSELLRERAAKALGAMPTDRSLNNLSALLISEPSTKVQAAALTSMSSSELKGTQLNQVYDFAKNAEDSDVRGAAIEALTKQIDTNPDVKDELKGLAKTERNKANLTSILNALYQ